MMVFHTSVTKNYLRAEEMLQGILDAEVKKHTKEQDKAIMAALQKNRRQLAKAQKQLYRSWYLAFCKWSEV